MKTNKKMIIGIILVLIILIAVAVYLTFFRKADKTIEKKYAISNEQAGDIFYNNVLISYIIEGDVQVGEGTAINPVNGKTYYAVNDPAFANIKNFEDINKLIENNISGDRAPLLFNKLYSSDYNIYMSFDNNLYVIKKDNPCTDIPMDSFNKDRVSISSQEDKMITLAYDSEALGIYNENDKWVARSIYYTCDEFEMIK